MATQPQRRHHRSTDEARAAGVRRVVLRTLAAFLVLMAALLPAEPSDPSHAASETVAPRGDPDRVSVPESPIGIPSLPATVLETNRPSPPPTPTASPTPPPSATLAPASTATPPHSIVPLRLIDLDPAPGETGIDVTTDVVASFNRPVGELDDGDLVLRDGRTDSIVPAAIRLDETQTRARLTPASSLRPGRPYEVSLGPVNADQAADVAPSDDWTFVTAPEVHAQRYHLEARIDADAGLLDVTETLDWTNAGDADATHINLSVIAAHVGAFRLTGPVMVDGVEADARFAVHPTNLRVAFPRPLPPTATAHIAIPFRLVVDEYGGAFGARLSRQRGVLQFGEWFPIWSTVHGFSDVGEPQVTWTADRITLDLTSRTVLGVDAVAASGARQPGATGSHWVFVAEDVRDFAFSVSADYQRLDATLSCEGAATVLHAYGREGRSAQLLEAARYAMERYNQLFGCYPYPSFTVAESGADDFSMEFPTMVFIGADHLDQPAIVYHEVAHQWWYGVVGNDQISEPWLDESFAEFSSRLLAGEGGHCSERSVASMADEFAAWSGCDGYLQAVYQKGATFLEELRHEMGDDAFFRALREIVDTYRFGVATTDGVLPIFEANAGRQLDAIYAEYGFSATGDPSIE